MKTVFLQLSDSQYLELIDLMVVGMNYSYLMVYEEADSEIKAVMRKEIDQSEKLLQCIGEQAGSQLSEIDD